MKLAGILTLLALAAPAAAGDETPQMFLRVLPTQGAPRVEVRIHGGPLLPAERIFLVDEHRTRIAASTVTPWKDMQEPVAVVILLAGSEVMIGNTSIEDDDSPSRYQGYLAGVRAGVTALDLGRDMPVGSKGMLITYEDSARIRVPMGPIANLVPEAVGTEKDYYYHLGSDLVGGVELALAELANVSTPRKVLIVIGDGNDTNNDLAGPRLRALATRAERERIETYGLIYKGALSAPSEIISDLIPAVQTVPSSDAIAPALAAIRAQIAKRYIVTFPGDKLDWLLERMYLTVELDGRTLEPVPVAGLAPPPGASAIARYNPFLSWWFQLAMGLGAVGAIALVMRWRARRRAAS